MRIGWESLCITDGLLLPDAKVQPGISMGSRTLLALLATMLACNTSSVKDITAKAGDPCQDCNQCCQIGYCCTCDTCFDFAFDSSNKQLLVCDSGTLMWRVLNECPGGGYARCDTGERIS